MEICKTLKKKAKEDIRKHNLDEIRETIEASKSLKRVKRTPSLGKIPDDNTTRQWTNKAKRSKER